MDENDALSEYNKIPLGHNRTNEYVLRQIQIQIQIVYLTQTCIFLRHKKKITLIIICLYMYMSWRSSKGYVAASARPPNLKYSFNN